MKSPFVLLLAIASVALPIPGQETGYIKTDVSPGRAGVFVDGKYMGPAANFGMSRKYAVAAGEHEVRLEDPRYQPMSTKVTVTAGKTTKISQKLAPKEPAKPPFGRVRTVHPDKFAAVYVNDAFFGHVDEFSNFAQGILLNPGEYTVRIEPAKGGTAVTKKITLKENETVIVQ